MDYVMDTVKGLDLEELIVITGHLKDVVERYIVEHYPVKATFVEQKTLDGTAGAINLAARTSTDRCSSSSWIRCSTPTCRSPRRATPTAFSGRRRSRTTSGSA